MKKELKAHLGRQGNIKVGKTIATWSTLKGNENYFIPELNKEVHGTCGKYCVECSDSCYVTKSYKRYTSRKTGKCSVKYGHAVNTIAMRENIEKCYTDLYNQIKRARNPISIVRIDQSGEIENAMQFGMWIRLANDFKDITFYIYTKAFDIVIPMLLTGIVPLNLVVNISIWHEYGIAEYNLVKHLPNVKAFVYFDGFDYAAHGLEIQTMCNAYDIKGKMNHEITCDRCKKCFNDSEKCKVIGCYDH